MGRRDIEIELGERRGQLIQKPRPIEAGDLHHRIAVGPLVVDRDRRLQREGADAALGRRPLGHHIRQPQFAAQGFLDRVGDAIGAPLFVFIAVEFARQRNGVEGAAVGRSIDLRVDDIGARHGAGPGDDRQQPGMIGRKQRQFGHRPLGVECG